MSHPNPNSLQRYADDALSAAASAAVRTHVSECASCRLHVARLQQMGRTTRALAPAPAAFSSEGAFWMRLAGHLNPARRAAWPLVSLLPPFVFVALGTLLDLLLGAAVLTRLLVRAGAIEPVGPVLCTRLKALAQTEVGGMFRAWIGPTAHQLGTRALESWAGMSPTLQDALLFVLIIASLGIALAGLVTLYGWWAACWTRQERLEGSRQAWNTAN